MDNQEKIKELKKELLELESKNVENDVVRMARYAAEDSAAVINILVSIGAIIMGIVMILVPDMDDSFKVMGAIVFIIGLIFIVFSSNKKSEAKSSYDNFKSEKADRESRILNIRTNLLDLE